jgi:hypothetical protein
MLAYIHNIGHVFRGNVAIFKKLWNDEIGAVLSAELMLVSTVMIVGLTAGLVTLRDALARETADMAAAVAQLDQSYVLPGITAHDASTAGTTFNDTDEPAGDRVADAKGIIVGGSIGLEGRVRSAS